jgi:hypothetical protein
MIREPGTASSGKIRGEGNGQGVKDPTETKCEMGIKNRNMIDMHNTSIARTKNVKRRWELSKVCRSFVINQRGNVG